MAYSYVWPPSLPQNPIRSGFSEEGGALITRTPMEKGPAKMQWGGDMPEPLAVTYSMTSAQVETFRDFVRNTIRGTSRFGWPHPRTRATAEVQLVPSGVGKLYTIVAAGHLRWLVSLAVEVLP